jgi:hypothetical protein
MSIVAKELADNLETEGRKTLEFFGGLQPEEWQVEVYSDGPAWKVHNLLAHFVEVEGSMRKLIGRIASGGEGVAADFNIDAWNAEHTAEVSQQSREQLLAEFAQRRADTVEMVRGYGEAKLERRGRHPALGITEVKHMLRLMYLHLQGHQRDIRRALKAAQPPS